MKTVVFLVLVACMLGCSTARPSLTSRDGNPVFFVSSAPAETSVPVWLKVLGGLAVGAGVVVAWNEYQDDKDAGDDDGDKQEDGGKGHRVDSSQVDGNVVIIDITGDQNDVEYTEAAAEE